MYLSLIYLSLYHSSDLYRVFDLEYITHLLSNFIYYYQTSMKLTVKMNRTWILKIRFCNVDSIMLKIRFISVYHQKRGKKLKLELRIVFW